jgi:hypothetical protein
MKTFLFIILLVCATSIHGDTLPEIQSHYVGRRVILKLAGAMDRYQRDKKGNYKKVDTLGNAYNGKEALILAIEPVRESLVRVIAKCKDGTLVGDVIEEDNLNILFSFSDFTNQDKAEAKRIQSHIDTLIGSTVYAQHDSTLYKSIATYEDLENELTGDRSYDLNCDAPNLVPLQITSSRLLYKASEHVFDRHLSTIQVKLPDDSYCLAIIYDEDFHTLEDVTDGAHLLTSIPSELTTEEIEAIQSGDYFRGMHLTALEYSLGQPNHTNDDGSGRLVLVYNDGTRIYVEDGVVTGWHLRH